MKDYRDKELKYYLIGNIIVIMFISLNMNPIVFLKTDYYQLLVTALSSALISAAFYSFLFVFDSVIPADWKPIISTLKAHMPGETVWTDIKENTKDKRFSHEDINSKYAMIYKNMPKEKKARFKYENKKWYEIYSKVQKSAKVELAQKDYLLCRDLNCCNVMTLLIYLVFSLLIEIVSFSWRVLVYLLIMYLLLLLATRNKGARFVKTVIAVDIYESK